MSTKAKKFVSVIAIAVVASLGVSGPSQAAPSHNAKGGVAQFKIGDGWCC